MSAACRKCYERLLGMAEIAEIAGVSRQSVVNWRSRHQDFPRPVLTLRMGPLFDRDEVSEWLKPRVVVRSIAPHPRSNARRQISGYTQTHKVERVR